MARRTVWFRDEFYRLLGGLAKRTGSSFNGLVNLAVEEFLGVCSEEELRLRAEKARLKREEYELRQDWRVICRSGSYLPQYVDKTIRPRDSMFRQGQVPLEALSPSEKQIFLRICARREAIAKRIVEIDQQLLPKEKFRLKPSLSRRRRRKSQSRHTHRRVDDIKKKEVKK